MPENGQQNLAMVTCTAPVNIAVIKYWGKRDEDLILPINSSLSVTLHQEQVTDSPHVISPVNICCCTTMHFNSYRLLAETAKLPLYTIILSQLKTMTTIACSRSFQQDRIWLNGKEEDISCPRLQSCLQEIRRLARKRRNTGDPTSDVSIVTNKVHICSVNNFPTAAGLASSAAGYACLVYTLSQLFGVEGELSAVARQGSGSACRSLYGGFVQWKMGEWSDGKDSIAEQVESESYWPELRVLILVVSAEQKSVGSTSGMHTSVKTSQLLKSAHRQCLRTLSVLFTVKERHPVDAPFLFDTLLEGRGVYICA
ncbi:Diphosphomevalonate decarboxylase [Anabarilius grahami]|uniref:Diphosphomevalonate decarboxylase n=1 Tax=Anabarilius grahami TaxID=495550 RepID=A0A3N0Z3U4_ANAGA|nr:Diphosphomevalonate decarboxylase [Anabarilius grahami]